MAAERRESLQPVPMPVFVRQQWTSSLLDNNGSDGDPQLVKTSASQQSKSQRARISQDPAVKRWLFEQDVLDTTHPLRTCPPVWSS